MDAFSSSFLSSIPHPNLSLTPLVKPPSSSLPPPRLNVSSVRTEDKPQVAVGSSPAPTIRPADPSPAPPPRRPPARRAPPPPPPPPSLPSAILNALEDAVHKFIDPPTRPSVDPRFVLSDNFAPVGELPPTECEVVDGALPRALDGAYIRNGPNPQFLPRGPYHLFDGDGMLQCIRISGGRATFCSRFVETYRHTVEREAGGSVFPNVFSGFSGLAGSAARGALAVARFAAGQYDPLKGIGLANTSLARFGGRLFALGESDLPYEVALGPDGDVRTLGRVDFDGKLSMSMTAHPKVDPDTGEAFAFRYGPVPPFLTYFRFDPDGNKQPDVPIFSMAQPSFMHDFGITKKYAIFADIQIGMDPMEMIMRGGSPVGLDPRKVSRIGVLPRYAADEGGIRWFDVPGFNIMHVINAWDETDEETGEEAVVVIAPNVLSAEHTLERMDLIHVVVERVRIGLKTGLVTRQPLSARNLDFGVINPAFLGKKSRYAYAGIGDPMPKVSGVVKLDLGAAEGRRECTVASRVYGPGCYGGEPFFVARDPDDPGADEDDGYVVSYVHDEGSGESRFVVMDARSPSLEVVASVRLPQRAPYGFHGLFVRERDLKR